MTKSSAFSFIVIISIIPVDELGKLREAKFILILRNRFKQQTAPFSLIRMLIKLDKLNPFQCDFMSTFSNLYKKSKQLLVSCISLFLNY